MNMILSPNGRFAVTTDMGMRQSLWSIDTNDGKGVSHVEFFNNPGPNATTNGLYYGLAFAPDGNLYAAQGNADSIAVLSLSDAGVLSQVRTIKTTKNDFPSGLVTDHRGFLYVANNDPSTFAKPGSVAVYNAAAGSEISRFNFSSSFGRTPNFPLAMSVLSNGSKLYVASQRDDAVYVLNTQSPFAPSLARTLPTGSHPDALLLNNTQSLLFVANAHSDTISVVSTGNDQIVATALLRPDRLRHVAGATPTGLALSPDEQFLYVSLGDMNAVAVLRVKSDENKVDLELEGYIPAGWYPTAVVASPDGEKLLVANAKGTKTRNPDLDYKQGVFEQSSSYIQTIIEGNVSLIDIPEKKDQLEKLTSLVLQNNGIRGEADDAENDRDDHEKGLSDHRLDDIKIKHVIYIVKENRTYDQVLGDLPQGNGDPSLVLFGRDVTPNQHAIAERFVLLDNFYDCGEVSGDGWPWSTQGMANEYVIKNVPYNYSDRGRNYDFEGQNNGYLTGGFPATDPDGNPLVIPGTPLANGAPSIPDVAEAPGGHLWDLARAAGVSYRNYGFYYSFGVSQSTTIILPDNYPASRGIQPADHDLKGVSDIDYRRYDNDYPDSDAPSTYKCSYSRTVYGKYGMPSRFSEWNREFKEMLAKDPSGNAVPSLMTVRFNHDHTQGVSPGKFTPRAEVADNDYAVGQLVEAVSESPIWESTAIFVIEDDAQDGPDHVDAHRSTCYVISPHIKANTVDQSFYNTDSVLKTIEMLLGLPPMSQYDAVANPILDFGESASNIGPFNAILPAHDIICEKTPALVKLKLKDPRRKLALLSSRMDFTRADSAPSGLLNEILWKSVKGANAVAPAPRHSLGKAIASKSAEDHETAVWRD
jgi:DNA-binding beta-propeller fold protein YncE